MNQKQFQGLKRGDLVCHKTSGDVYVIEHSAPGIHFAIRSVRVTNSVEWDQVGKDGRVIEDEPRYTIAEIAGACGEVGISAQKFESLSIALEGG